LFKPWSERKRNATVLQKELQDKLNKIAGARIAAFQFPHCRARRVCRCNS
jgi:multidrug efflux pump